MTSLLERGMRAFARFPRRLLDPAPGDRAARVTLVLLTLFLLFLRKPDAFLNPQLWAEDGTVFLTDHQLFGLPALWRTHGRYFHLLPRVVAELVGIVGLLWTPALYNLAALGAVVFVAQYLLSARIRLPSKGLMVLALVLCPHRGEVFLTITNMQWITSLALLLLAISNEPTGRGERALDLGVLTLTGLTGPFVALFLPIFAARVALRRSRWSQALLGVAALLALVQLLGIEIARNEGAFDPGDPTWLALIGRSFAGLLLIGDRPLAVPVSDIALTFASVALYVFFAIFCVLERDSKVAMLLAGGLAVFASAAYAYRGDPQELVDAIGVRYWYAPMVTLLWAASAGLHSCRVVALASGVVWILAVGSTLSMFAAPRYVDFHWADGVACAQQKGSCTVPINPPGWSFTLRGTAETTPATGPADGR